MVQRVCFKLLIAMLLSQLPDPYQACAGDLRTRLNPRFYHYSFFSDSPEEIEKTVKECNSTSHTERSAPGSIIIGIVPHHFLAKDMIRNFYTMLARHETDYDTIIIVGPDHNKHGMNPVSLTDLPWKTAFGIAETNEALVINLQRMLDISLDPEAFCGEHSISLHMDFIKHYYPEAKVMPIMISSRAPRSIVEKLSSVIYQNIKGNKKLLMVSIDFAHNCTAVEAEQFDSITREVVRTGALDLVSQVNVDCKACLASVLMLMQKFSGFTFEFLEHSNSSIIANKPDLSNVTSYFTIIASQP